MLIKYVCMLHSAALLQLLHVIWSMPTNFTFFKKPPDNFFFINLTILRSIANKYTLQVSRTLETGKAFKYGLRYNQFFPQILCLQVSILIIQWHCFQVSYARTHLAKRDKFASKKTFRLLSEEISGIC